VGKHRYKRYGICHGVNLSTFFASFVIPFSISEISQISTGNEIIDLGIRVGISHLIGYLIASIMDWHD